MDELTFVVFALAALVGGFVSGFSGFAMGLVVSGVWLHIMTPIQTATLIAGYGLLTQGYGIFKLRNNLDWRKAWLLGLGTVIGIPVGVGILSYLNPGYLRLGVGVLLIVYAIYGLARPFFAPMKIGTGADIAIGISNGVLGGLAGLGGIISTISCQWRGWPKDVQRAVFQPVLFVAFVVISVSQIASAASRARCSRYMHWASRSWSPGCGPAFDCSERLTTKASARRCCCCCCSPDCR